MRKILLALAALIVVGGIAAGLAVRQYRPDRAVQVATEFIAHTLCTATFVSNLDPDQVYREALRPARGIRVLNRGIRYNVDKLRKEVTVSFLRNFDGYAVFRGETGCVIGHEGEYIPPIMDAARNEEIAAILPDISGPEVVEPKNEKLKAALDRAFADAERGPRRNTKAVVVLHKGKIVAERYAPDVNIDTRLLGYSLSKSVINVLVGVFVRQGKLKVDGPAPVDEWKDASDPRHAITIENLMRMTSGLDLDETNSGFDPASQILMLEGDMAGASARAPLKALPGMRWHYSSPSTLILSRIVKNNSGGADGVERFARRELFAPLGMKGMTLEFDGAGTPVGSTFFLGRARDWARFGQLYLLDGVIEGKRILPAGWVKWSATPTVESPEGYAAGFFTNQGDSRGAKARVKDGLPADSFVAAGALGQRIVIVPSSNLVVVRMGVTQDFGNADYGVGRLVSDVIAAVGNGT